MGGFPQGYWYLLMVAGKPGPKKDEEIAAVLQPVISVVRVCPLLPLAPLPSILDVLMNSLCTPYLPTPFPRLTSKVSPAIPRLLKKRTSPCWSALALSSQPRRPCLVCSTLSCCVKPRSSREATKMGSTRRQYYT